MVDVLRLCARANHGRSRVKARMNQELLQIEVRHLAAGVERRQTKQPRQEVEARIFKDFIFAGSFPSPLRLYGTSQ